MKFVDDDDDDDDDDDIAAVANRNFVTCDMMQLRRHRVCCRIFIPVSSATKIVKIAQETAESWSKTK